MAQIVQTLSIEALKKLSKPDRIVMNVKLKEPLFQQFIRFQEESARRQIYEYDPNASFEKPEEYLATLRQMHQVRAFWSDFLAFCQTYNGE